MENKEKNTNMQRNLTLEQAKEDYEYLISEATEKQLWFEHKGLNLYLSVYELQDAWEFGKYLFPASYWQLINPNEYLKPHSKKLQKSQNMYDYAHKRLLAYVKRLEQITNNKTN